jgi:hypothetical protein
MLGKHRLAVRSHGLYINHALRPVSPSRRSTSRRSVALALTVRPVTASRGATTRCPDCTGSTAPMSCIRTRGLTTRLLVGRSHWLSPCVRSLRLAARLLVVRIAQALLRLCRASGCAVSSLNLSSIGCTGPRRVPAHSVVRRDYPSRGCNGYTSLTPRVRVPWHVARLVVDFFAYAARPGASARRTARRADRRRLLRLAQAGRRLLRLRRASRYLGALCGSSRLSSSTTSTTPRIRVPRHTAPLVRWLVAPLVVDFFAYAVRLSASAHRTARRRLLRLAQARRDSFAYAARPGASARHAARHAARRAARR